MDMECEAEILYKVRISPFSVTFLLSSAGYTEYELLNKQLDSLDTVLTVLEEKVVYSLPIGTETRAETAIFIDIYAP